MELVELAKKYFDFFSNKDIQNLKNLFSENVILKDWEIEAKGKNEVVEANKKIFNSVESITVTPKNIYQDKFVLICVIEVLINKVERLNVIDILKFNKNKKIEEISAFKQ
tara:strand:- start:683 stop:1012 length:330 start_codon:yes stop_codon:yes gene_type:complete